MKGLKEQIAGIERSVPIDLDPESLETFDKQSDDSANSGSEDDAFDGREHYQVVGKSKLRKPEDLVLGKQYSGSTVSRDTLNANAEDQFSFAPLDDEEEDDPFAKPAADFDSDGSSVDERIDKKEEDGDQEIDSDEAFDKEDEERFSSFKFRGSSGKAPIESYAAGGSDDESGSEIDAEAEESITELSDNESDVAMEDIASGTDSSSDQDSTSETSASPLPRSSRIEASSDREKLKAILSNDAATVASSLSAAVHADATKGKAVRVQYQTFDRLLDARIKLQKAISASNDLPSISADKAAECALKDAESAALSLWSTIESIRYDILSAHQLNSGSSSKKRKRPSPATTSTSTSDLWSRTQTLESLSIPSRRTTLDKWSSKTRVPSVIPTSRSQLLDGAQPTTQDKITSILDSHLTTETPKLVSASTVPNTSSSTRAPPSYTDTVFYQTLLRDLIASRAASVPSTTGGSGQHAGNNGPHLADMPLMLPTKLHVSGSKDKAVDTRASKGRKVRYTVHEKLQNFAVEEQRGSWDERAAREFFASLFGGAGGLDEEDTEEMIGSGDEGLDGREEVEALRLFRN